MNPVTFGFIWVLLMSTTACLSTQSTQSGRQPPAASPGVSAQQPVDRPGDASTAASPERPVDFANFTFPWVSGLGNPRRTFTLRNGSYGGSKDEVPLNLRSINYGDVTSDGEEEAIVVLDVVVEGGTAGPNVVYIYALNKKGTELLWAFTTGARADGGLRRVYAEDGHLVVELNGKNRVVGRESKSIEDQIAVCCPKFFTRSIYQWRDKKFEPTGDDVTLPVN